ncbi:MAG TPA: hypothetical protein DCM86_03365 [Verrucomicrobiales bacterium]|nr:hypothetical protein [Verrucomicrobiales bacterium]
MRDRFESILAGLLLLLLIPGLPGCSTRAESSVDRWVGRKLDRPVGAGYSPRNVYRAGEALPADLRRVALLPLVTARPDGGMPEGQVALEPVVERELEKRLAFEVVRISRDQVRLWTGRSDWHAEEALPPELLNRIRESYGCQGVIFAQLTEFHPYGPVQIGWRLRLVDSRKAEVYWAVDEVFDAGVPAVANAARRYAQDFQRDASPVPDSEFVLSSPRRFGEYSLHALFATLPGH